MASKIIAAGVILAICYVAASVIIVFLVSILLSILLEPGVEVFKRLRIPGSVGAFLMVVSLLLILYLSILFLYGRADNFARQLPSHFAAIRQRVSHIVAAAEDLERQVNQIFQSTGKKEQQQPVALIEHSVFTQYLFPGFETAYNFLVAVSLIPFLTFFMLTWKEHLLRSFLQVLDETGRDQASRGVTDIIRVLQKFLYGNIILGLILSGFCLILFLGIGLPFPYILALLSGFVTLIPYLGMILSIALPFMFALGQTSAQHLTLLIGLLAIHLIGINVLLPKLVGSMVALNPLVVTAALVLWGWMWGAMGFILAIPILAATKVICDNVPKLKLYGKLLGTS